MGDPRGNHPVAVRRTATSIGAGLLPSLTVENYVKTIYQICLRQSGEPAATGQVATQLEVSPGSVTSMLKTLSEAGLAIYTPYEGVHLTSTGKALALRVLRRHRLIELFLAKTLNLSWDEVHEEAEQMEHAVSDRLVDRIDAFLDFPDVDPHGDPIPRADGSIAAQTNYRLTQCQAGDHFRLTRVMDQSPDFLRYLTETGLSLGTTGHVVTNREEAGIVTVIVSDGEMTLASEAANKLVVTPL
jgi:DtxR family Mn-dependent transcriptional regulator